MPICFVSRRLTNNYFSGIVPAPSSKREKELQEKRLLIAIPDDRPRLAVVYEHGVMQMMRHESDTGTLHIFFLLFVLSRYAGHLIQQIDHRLITSQ